MTNTPAQLSELVDRVEAATGPDRFLDARIRATLEMPEQPVLTDCPAYTASIDAALALVERKLPGWFWRGGHVPSFHWTGTRNVDCWAHLSRTDASNCDKEDEATGWCNTVPLALVAALLHALAHQGAE